MASYGVRNHLSLETSWGKATVWSGTVSLEASLEDGPLSGAWRQAALVISSLLLALAVGVITQLILAWALGPGWASSLALITIGWSLFLVVARGQGD